jgi:choline dehydrogenase-like flavoprotein
VTAARDQVDVVIVGSGPAGSTYARLICDRLPDARVLLVEAGPVVSEPPGAHVNTIPDRHARARAKVAAQGPTQYSYGIPSAELRLLAHRSARDGSISAHSGLFLLSAAQDASPDFPAASLAENVGGMGAHWFGACPRPAGTERIGFLDEATLDAALATAEGLLRVSATQWAGSERAARREGILSGLFDQGRAPDRRVQPMPLAVCREAPGTGQSGPAVILGALLGETQNHFELRPGTLCRRVAMNGGRAAGVELVDLASATAYQVAADHVVLAADTLRTPQLLFASGVRPAALGRHLNEHPYVAAILESDEPDEAGSEPGDYELNALMPANGVTWVPFDGDHFPMQAQLHQWASLLAIGIFMPKEIAWDNRVEFSDSAVDWRGLPSMRVHYSLSAADLQTVERAREVMATIARACTGTSMNERPGLMPNGTSLHYQGTVRMGPQDDGTSVCDRHSRVWGTENLYVAGNGVIPTSTACNPTLTSAALAVIGAHEIVSQMRSGCSPHPE